MLISTVKLISSPARRLPVSVYLSIVGATPQTLTAREILFTPVISGFANQISFAGSYPGEALTSAWVRYENVRFTLPVAFISSSTKDGSSIACTPMRYCPFKSSVESQLTIQSVKLTRVAGVDICIHSPLSLATPSPSTSR